MVRKFGYLLARDVRSKDEFAKTHPRLSHPNEVAQSLNITRASLGRHFAVIFNRVNGIIMECIMKPSRVNG